MNNWIRVSWNKGSFFVGCRRGEADESHAEKIKILTVRKRRTFNIIPNYRTAWIGKLALINGRLKFAK